MAGLERAGCSLREERGEEHEVPPADDRAAAAAEQPRDVAAGEAAAEHEDPTLRLHAPIIARMQVAVIGSGVEHEAPAEEVGRLLAERGVTVVCGGRLEVMAAAARGAKQAGGTTIGILPGETRGEAEEGIDY